MGLGRNKRAQNLWKIHKTLVQEHVLLSPKHHTMYTDILSDIIRTLRLEGSILFYTYTGRPWLIHRLRNLTPTFVVPLYESCFVQSLSMSNPVEVANGEIFFVADGRPYWIGDRRETPHVDAPKLGVALESARQVNGTSTGLRRQLMCGLLNIPGGIEHPLIRTLPPILHTPRRKECVEWLAKTVALFGGDQETAADGRNVLTDRLCEILFVQVLRAANTKHTPGFLAAMRDPAVRAALDLIHSDYHIPWTIEALAHRAHTSRSSLARRFSELLGMPPIGYLTTWRMHQSRHLLIGNPEMSVEQVALAVGYSSREAFEKAFKRHFGSSPRVARTGGRMPRGDRPIAGWVPDALPSRGPHGSGRLTPPFR